MPLLSRTDRHCPDDRFARVSIAAADLFAELRRDACHRLHALEQTPDIERLDRLIAAGAWTDAALTLIAIELPSWQLRRLAYDDGEWHCALSLQRNMPDWLDTAVETHHPQMALALLGALREAVTIGETPRFATMRSTPELSESFEPMPCDNYA